MIFPLMLTYLTFPIVQSNKQNIFKQNLPCKEITLLKLIFHYKGRMKKIHTHGKEFELWRKLFCSKCFPFVNDVWNFEYFSQSWISISSNLWLWFEQLQKKSKKKPKHSNVENLGFGEFFYCFLCWQAVFFLSLFTGPFGPVLEFEFFGKLIPWKSIGNAKGLGCWYWIISKIFFEI